MVVLSVAGWTIPNVSLANRVKQGKPRLADRVRGTVGPQEAGLPLTLPKPQQMPRFEIEAGEGGGLDAAGNYLGEHVVRSQEPLDKFSRKHELFHTLDYDQLSMADRMAIAKIIRPRRAAEAATEDGWWGETGAAAGGHAGIAEDAADYYAAAATNLRLKPRRRAGMMVADQQSAYAADMRPRRLAEFRRFLDEWSRRLPPPA